MNEFMQMAIAEAEEGISLGHGGPFGAVIVKNGKVIGKGHNRVVINNDPTLHGEISAIRDACANISCFDLTGADIYTTGEPCPMCLSACLWANINKIYYGCSIAENNTIGFRDEILYKHLSISTEKMRDRLIQTDHDDCLRLFQKYLAMKNKVSY